MNRVECSREYDVNKSERMRWRRTSHAPWRLVRNWVIYTIKRAIYSSVLYVRVCVRVKQHYGALTCAPMRGGLLCFRSSALKEIVLYTRIFCVCWVVVVVVVGGGNDFTVRTPSPPPSERDQRVRCAGNMFRHYVVPLFLLVGCARQC